jgi:hypothetical protein
VSPLTIDWVNPEAPWPHLDELRQRTENRGFTLKPRLPVYPEYITDDWIDAGLRPKVDLACADTGYVFEREPENAK